MKTNTHLWLYLARLFWEGEIFEIKVVEKTKTNISCSITFFSENGAVYEIMWENIVEPDRPQMAVWGMRIARRTQIPIFMKIGPVGAELFHADRRRD